MLQVPEDRHCLKQNTYTSLDLNSVILNGIWCFRQAKTDEEEVNLVQNVVLKSTWYKNKWAYGIFEEWQWQHPVKVPLSRSLVYLKNYDFHQVESLETPLVEIRALFVNY